MAQSPITTSKTDSKAGLRGYVSGLVIGFSVIIGTLLVQLVL